MYYIAAELNRLLAGRERPCLISQKLSMGLSRKLNHADSINRLGAGLHKLWYPSIRDTSMWGKFGAHGEHGDVFLFSNLGAL